MWNIFRNEYSERQRRMFADQFEPQADGFVYRKSLKGYAIPVTIAERQRFIDEYDRRCRYSTWTIIVGLTLVSIGLVLWSLNNDGAFPDFAGYATIGVVAAISISYVLWAWGAPARELQQRAPIAGERSQEEVRRRLLGKTSYGQLASTAFVGVVAAWSLGAKHGGFTGWGRLWLVLAGLTLVFAIVAAIRKWRFENRDDDRPF